MLYFDGLHISDMKCCSLSFDGLMVSYRNLVVESQNGIYTGMIILIKRMTVNNSHELSFSKSGFSENSD